MPINQFQTNNENIPSIVLSDNAFEEIDGFFDYLFDGVIPFGNAVSINREVSNEIDNLSYKYRIGRKTQNVNEYVINILRYGTLTYSILRNKRGRLYIYIKQANFGGYRPHVPSATNPTHTPLTKRVPQIVYQPTGKKFFGYEIGFDKDGQKYNILNNNHQPISKLPMLKKPRFFKYPFGKYSIIAHCNIGGWLWAMDMKGKFYNMHKMWKDAYLYEVIQSVFNEYVNKQLLTEGQRSYRFRLLEKDLRWIIRRTLNEITKIA